MTTRRVTDDSERSVFQSDRLFTIDGRWFFSTREKTTLGPFARRNEAEAAVSDYIAKQTGQKTGWTVPGAAH